MSNSTQLRLPHAVLCEEGGKTGNEDAARVVVPGDPHLLTYKGVVLAVADGVSSAEGGHQASTTAIQTFATDYYTTPDTWSVGHSGEQLLSTINQRLYRHSHAYTNNQKGQLCTFSAVVLKSHTAHFFHLGDSRIYHWRAGQLTQLTQDHTTAVSQQQRFLSRALGMDSSLQLDYGQQTLTAGDYLLLCSDGLHDFVSDQHIQILLSTGREPEELATELRTAAMTGGCDDNLSIVLARVDELPAESIDDYNERLTRLPFPPALGPGHKVDGYEVVAELFASSRSHLYRVKDLANGQHYVMKTPSPNFADDSSYIERFIREEWIGSRIDSPYVVEVIRPHRPKTMLYYLMEEVPGVAMDKWLTENDPVKPGRAIRLIEKIAAGIKAFHDREAVHQDLKPGNIMIQPDGSPKIVDFGSVFVAGVAEVFIPIEHESVLGTTTYSDPQYLMGKNSGFQGDVYALATICYELFTGALPYGEKINDCQTPSDYDRLRYTPARHVNPAIPVWFDRALEKGVSFDLYERYPNIDALLTDLTRPNPEFLRKEVNKSTRNSSLLFWQLLSGFWFITLVLVLYLFAIS